MEKNTTENKLNHQTPVKNVGVLFLLTSKSVIEVFTSNPKKTMRESFLNMWKNGFILLVYIQTLFVCLLYGSWREKLTTVLAIISFYSLLLFWNNQIVFWTSSVFLSIYGLSLATVFGLTFLVNVPFFRNIIDEKLGPDFVKIYGINPRNWRIGIRSIVTLTGWAVGGAVYAQVAEAAHHTYVVENTNIYLKLLGDNPTTPLDRKIVFDLLNTPNPTIPSLDSIGNNVEKVADSAVKVIESVGGSGGKKGE